MELQEVKQEIDVLTHQIISILKNHSEARNSDAVLLSHWLQEFQNITTMQEFHNFCKTDSLKFSSIARIRRKIQSSGRFLPSAPAIIYKRKLETVYRVIMKGELTLVI